MSARLDLASSIYRGRTGARQRSGGGGFKARQCASVTAASRPGSSHNLLALLGSQARSFQRRLCILRALFRACGIPSRSRDKSRERPSQIQAGARNPPRLNGRGLRTLRSSGTTLFAQAATEVSPATNRARQWLMQASPAETQLLAASLSFAMSHGWAEWSMCSMCSCSGSSPTHYSLRPPMLRR